MQENPFINNNKSGNAHLHSLIRFFADHMKKKPLPPWLSKEHSALIRLYRYAR